MMNLWYCCLILAVVLWIGWKIREQWILHKFKQKLKNNDEWFEIFTKYSHIRLIGCCASGKSTLCDNLFESIPQLKSLFHYISLDNIKHKKNSGFKLIRGERYKQALLEQLEISKHNFSGNWIVDGNAIPNKMLKCRIWDGTQVVIFLNYNFWTVFLRGCIRTMKRIIFQIKCCNGNQETLYKTIYGKTKDSAPKLIWYSHKTWQKKLNNIKTTTVKENVDKIVWIVFDDPIECDYWFAQVVKHCHSKYQ